MPVAVWAASSGAERAPLEALLGFGLLTASTTTTRFHGHKGRSTADVLDAYARDHLRMAPPGP